MLAKNRLRGKRRVAARRMSLEKLEARQVLDASSLPGLTFEQFGSAADLSQFLLDDALRRYESLFGQPTWGGGCGFRGDFCLMAMDNMGPAVPMETRDHSTTNTQVAGVDEADIIENDGEYLYVLGDREVVIADAWPAEEMNIASRVRIHGTPFAEFLLGNRLGVLSHVNSPIYYGGPIDTVSRLSILPGPYEYQQPQIQFTLIDVADRTVPRIVSETKFDGSYTAARAIGSTVYIVSSGQFGIPSPNYTCEPIEPTDDEPKDNAAGDVAAMVARPYPWQDCVYETREEFLARVTGHEIELGVPQMTAGRGDLPVASVHTTTGTSNGSTGTSTGGTTSTGSTDPGTDPFIITGPLTPATDIYRPGADDYWNLIAITSFDLNSNIPGPIASTAIPTTSTAVVYASTDSLYLANPDWGSRSWNGVATSIVKFDFGDGGSVNLAAQGYVPGQLLNQFAMDEHEGYLRIATTYWRENWQNAVYVLEQNGRSLDVVGSITGLGPGERIFAVRFLEDRGFVVTFRQTDPLFALDLSDPTSPEVTGELHIPGFSNYLQPVDDWRLVGIGRDADAMGRAEELQVSLFDVGDMSNPQLAARYNIDVRGWSYSEATTDHHAVGFYPGYNVLTIPVTNGYGWEWIDRDGDGTTEFYSYRPRTDLWVFKLNLDPTFAPVPLIELLGRVEHTGHIRRSTRIEGVLYAISENTITAHAILNPDRKLGSIYFGREMIGVPLLPTPVDDPVITLATQSPELTAPVVTGAAVASSTWSPDFVSLLGDSGFSTTSSAQGGASATNVNWNNVNQVKLTFSEDVAVGQTDLTVKGADGTAYNVVGFSYDPNSKTAIWTLERSAGADRLTVALSDSVTDRVGNRMDGNRDGTAGGEFKFSFTSLAGDVNRDGIVDNADVAAVAAASFRSVASADFNLAADLDGDGFVTFRDAIIARNQLGATLPAAAAAPASVITQVGSRRRIAARLPTETADPTPALKTTGRRDRLPATAVDSIIDGGDAPTTAQRPLASGRRGRVPARA